MVFFAARMFYARAPVSFGFAGYDSLVETYSHNGRGQALFINCGTTIQTVDTVPPKEPGGLQRPIVKYLQSGGKVSEEIDLICAV